MGALKPLPVHVVIPDTQLGPGRPALHLEWIGEWCHERYHDKKIRRIMLGDWYNMGSLSSYDRKGGKLMEGARIDLDIEIGNEAWPALGRNRKWDDHYLLGNHEQRIMRAVEQDATLDGLFSYDMLKHPGWQRHGFLEVVDLDGIWYSHYFYNPNTGRPYTGTIDARLKNIGHSFTMGHLQGRLWGTKACGPTEHVGLVAGSCYLHDEPYLGPQGNSPWQGIIVCNNVVDGQYDPMFVGLDYLCRRYEGMSLAAFKERYLS